MAGCLPLLHATPGALRPRRQEGHWAVFGAGWDDYVLGRSRGLVCELFEGGGSAPPAIGLGLQVRDVQGALEKASARGARFEPEVAGPVHPAGAHLEGPAGVRWSLHQTDTARSADDLSEPEITRVELHVADLQGQIEFYHRILGLPNVTRDGFRTIVLRQHPDGPELVLLPGGRRHVPDPRWKEQPALGQKVFLGFMTEDIHRAASQLKSAGVRILHEVEHHDWDGTDLIVADADGNAVQVFKLDTDHRFGSGRAR